MEGTTRYTCRGKRDSRGGGINRNSLCACGWPLRYRLASGDQSVSVCSCTFMKKKSLFPDPKPKSPISPSPPSLMRKWQIEGGGVVGMLEQNKKDIYSYPD